MKRCRTTQGMGQAKFDALLRAERWEDLEDHLREIIREDPKNHWAVTNIAMACNEQRRYREAKEWSDLAYGLDPRCPLVRWDRACIYAHLGDAQRAIAFWESIVQTSEREIQENPCWESAEWTKRMLADCWYRLCIAYLREWRFPESEDAQERYKKLVALGAPSIYTPHELDHALERILKERESTD